MRLRKPVFAALLFLPLSSFGASYESGGSSGAIADGAMPSGCTPKSVVFINNSGAMECDATHTGNDILNSTYTMSTTEVGAIETAAVREAMIYGGNNGAELATGRWLDFYYQQTGAVTTAHGIGFFARLHGDTGNQGFMSAIEGNTLCTSTITTANCVGLIAHTKGDYAVNTAVGASFIGVNSRIDLTSDGFGTVAFATGTVIHFRPDPSSIGGKAGMRFGYYTTDTDLQIVNAGNILKIPPSTQVVGSGATIDVSKSCGGVLFLSSVGAVTTDTTNTFTVSSGNATDGTYNNGCQVTLINVDSADAITLDANARFVTFDGNNVVLAANGGSVHIASYSAGVTWVQTTLKTK